MRQFVLDALDTVTVPSTLIAIMGAVGVILLLLRFRRTGRTLLLLSVLALLLGGLSPLGAFSLAALEDRFPPVQLPPSIAGFIVLGGAVDTHITEARSQPAFNDAGERLTAALALAIRYPEARIVLAGGGSADHGDKRGPTESAISKDILVAAGVPATRVALEEASHNTCQDATQTKALVDPQRSAVWLLVTSASHMPRAIGCFRAAGFPVQPYPVDFRTRGKEDFGRPAASVGTGLALLDLAAHEWFGLVTYRLAGRIRELFPAP